MKCPLLSKECIQAKCAWWMEFAMKRKDPPEMTVEKSCAIPRLPVLLIELIKNTNSVGAAVESRGNTMIHRQEMFLKLAVRKPLTEDESKLLETKNAQA